MNCCILASSSRVPATGASLRLLPAARKLVGEPQAFVVQRLNLVTSQEPIGRRQKDRDQQNRRCAGCSDQLPAHPRCRRIGPSHHSAVFDTLHPEINVFICKRPDARGLVHAWNCAKTRQFPPQIQRFLKTLGYIRLQLLPCPKSLSIGSAHSSRSSWRPGEGGAKNLLDGRQDSSSEHEASRFVKADWFSDFFFRRLDDVTGEHRGSPFFRQRLKTLLYFPVLRGHEREHYYASARLYQPRQRFEQRLQLLHLAIHHQTQSHEGLRCWMNF